MASVSRPATRGQVLLLTGLGLAALLVVLALVLNTGIYTENEAARATAALDVSQLLRAQHQAVGVAETAIAAENDGGHRSYATMHGNLSRHLSVWTELSSRHGAIAVQGVRFELVSTRNGTRVLQEADGPFTNAYGASEWTLVDGATAARTLELTVHRSSLVAPQSASNASALAAEAVFAVRVDEGSTRRVHVYRDAGSVVVAVTHGGGVVTGACQTADTPVTIDLVGETVAGTACPALAGFLDISASSQIGIENGDGAQGTFLTVVDADAIDDDVTAPGFGGIQPRGERLLYDATVAFTVTTPTIEYAVVIDGVGGVDQ